MTSRKSRVCSIASVSMCDVVAPLGRDSFGHRPTGRGRLQRCPLSRDRARRGAMARKEPCSALHANSPDRRWRDERFHRRGCAARPTLTRPKCSPSRLSRLPWYSRSVDSTYLTGKRVFIFGDATHVLAAARIAENELGFEVVGLGTYSREFAREIREAAKLFECRCADHRRLS